MATVTDTPGDESAHAPVLLDRDPEETDESCPHCGESLVVKSELMTDGDRKLVCSNDDCEFVRYEPHAGSWSVFWPLRYLHDRFVWPVVDAAPFLLSLVLLILALAWGWNHGAYRTLLAGVVYTVVATYLSARLVSISRGRWCPACGAAVGDDAFCRQCSADLDEPIEIVSADDGLSTEGLTDVLTAQVPYLRKLTVFDTQVATDEHTGLAGQLVAGREGRWRQVLDGGTVVGVVGALAGVVVLVSAVGWTWLAPGLLAADPGAEVAPADPEPVNLLTVGADFGAWLIDVLAWASQPAVLAAIVAVLFGLYASLVLHELGHGIALALHDHDVEEYGLAVIFGVVPNYAWTKPEYDHEGDRSLRPALHVATGGATVNLLTGGVVYFGWALFLFLGPVPVPDVLWYLGAAFVVGSAIGVVNLFPFPGADGYRVVTHLGGWLGYVTSALDVETGETIAGGGVFLCLGLAFLGLIL